MEVDDQSRLVLFICNFLFKFAIFVVDINDKRLFKLVNHLQVTDKLDLT